MTTRLEKPGSFSPRRVALALFASVFLHGLFLLGSAFLKAGLHDTATPITVDPFIREGPGLLLDLSSGSRKKPARGADEAQEALPVYVDQGPAIPFTPGSEPGPSVLPRTGNVGASGSTSTNVGRGGGGGDGASFFHVAVACRRAVFVIDRSLSMGPGGGLAEARKELSRCLKALPPETEFQIVLYNRAAESLPCRRPGGLLIVDEETVRGVEEVLANTDAEGGTDHEKAFLCALAFEPDAVFLVTDADDLTPELLKAITSRNRGRAAIHTIDVGRRLLASSMLEELARQNHGTNVRAFPAVQSAWPH
jgi:von Willebrand factor type A domain